MSEKLHEEDIEQNFNDSELEDIMSEIESLEKEFGGDDTSDEESSLEDISNEELQMLDADSNEDLTQEEEALFDSTDENNDDEFHDESEEISQIVSEVEDEVEEEVEQKLKFDDIESLEDVQDEFELIKNPDPEVLEKLKVDSFEAEKTKLQKNIDTEIESAVANISSSTIDEVTNMLNGDSHSIIAEGMVPDEDLEGELQAIAKNHTEQKVEHHVSEEIVDNNLIPLKDNDMSKSNQKQVSEMNFEVSGNICMKMNFKLSGKDVILHLGEADGLTVELPGGIKFTVPLEEKKAS